MRINGKTQDEANEAVSNNTAIPDERVSSFIEFVELLWSTPKEKIAEKKPLHQGFHGKLRKTGAGSIICTSNPCCTRDTRQASGTRRAISCCRDRL